MSVEKKLSPRNDLNMSKKRFLGRTSRIVGLCSVANFINAADRVIMPIAIVPMTDQYHWSLQLQGWILSSFAFGYLTSQVNLSNFLTSSFMV